MPIVTMPDGTNVEMPENLTPELAARLKALQAQQGNGSEPPKSSGASGSYSHGASGSWEPQTGKDRFKRGFMDDPIAGLQQLAAETETAGFLAPEWAKKKRAEIQQKEDAYQSARQAAGDSGIDWERLGGQVVNPLNLGIAAITKLPPGATLPTRIASGALSGGTMSGVAPVYGDATRAGQTGLGMAGGALAAPLTGGAARVVKPKVDTNLALLRKEGITPTIGQSMGGMWKAIEDKAMSLPLVGDAITAARRQGLNQFQTAGYNRALSPIGAKASGKVGFEGMQEVHKALSSAYDDILPKMNFKPDQVFIQQTQQLRGIVPNTERKLYDSIVNRVMNRATPQGNMSGETFKNVESSLGEEISKLARDPSYEKQLVADALKQYRESLREGLSRSNPMFAKRLKDINEGWANYAILRQGASGASAAKNEGMFTPAQLAQGVQSSAKRQGQAVGRGKLSEGKALMQDLTNAGQQVLPSQYPDSGTAGRIAQGVVLGGAAAGGAPFTLGTAAGLAGASLPYLPGARKGMDLLLNARPQGAESFAELIRRYPGLFAPVAPSIVNGGNNR